MWRFIALLLALIAGVAAAMWYYRSPETSSTAVRTTPRNEDRWLDDLQSRNPKEVEAATAEIEARGTAALPLIRRTLQDDGASEERKKSALKACAILGVRAAEAIPDIATLMSDATYSAEAGLALSFMGSAAVPVLKDAVDDDDPAVRKEALRSLGKLRERASIDPQLVIPILLGALNDSEGAVREIAVTYLGIVRDDPAKEIPPLTTALSDDEPGVRRAAATALGAYGPQAQSALPALRKAAKDEDEDVQREAGRAIITISEKTPR
ncbi:MAG TPA: HEAT repeat domain-containing protein [Vicinamibacterales bacterium]|nr:HEAT repeat domain-containing protein [Vicinamibacterales bacterium]